MAAGDWRPGGKSTNVHWEQFNALPQFEDVSDFHCVTTWSKFDCRWTGVAFFTLVDLVRPKAEVKHVLLPATTVISTNVRLSDCLDDDVLIATQFDGKPITREHGGPARDHHSQALRLERRQVRAGQIEFSAQDKPGFWEVRGYSNTADPWTEDRFS